MASALPPPASSRSKLILVVDDEAKVREAIGRYLEMNGYTVVTAADGPAALEHAAARRPDLVLLDVMMPGIDGFTVLGRMKRDDALRTVPVIMLTGRGETSAIFLSQDLRATDYVIKPIDLDALLDVIRRYVF
jgi:two-component system, OmpR family, response regulator ResD